MARARLSFIVGLIVHILQTSVLGQQCGLPNNFNLELIGNLATTNPRAAGLISNGNTGCSLNSPQTDKSAGLQGFLNLQQLHTPVNLPLLPICGTVQPALVRKNTQQSLNVEPQLTLQPTTNPILQQSMNIQQSANQNCQQCLTSQQMQTQIPQQVIDLQQLQNLQQDQNLQQLVLQQQSSQSTPLNLQIMTQETPVQNELSFSSLPMVNGQLGGLPSQVSQGVLLSNLGFTSNLHSITPNKCSKTTEQVFIPQNNVVSNIPISVNEGTQGVNSVPISIVASCSPAESIRNNPVEVNPALSILPFSAPIECEENNPTKVKSALFPINFQNSPAVYQNQPCEVFNPLASIQSQSATYHVSPNQITVQSGQIPTTIQAQPFQVQTQPGQIQPVLQQPNTEQCVSAQLVQEQPIQRQPNAVQYLSTQPVQEQPVQRQPIKVQCAPTQPAPGQPSTLECTASQPTEAQYSKSVQNEPVNNPSQYQPSLESLLMSRFQPSNSAQQYSNNLSPYPSNPNYGSKSSSMKAILPLLFNLLKEKNMGCGCPPNYNCGCMNNNKSPDLPNWNPGKNNNYHKSPVTEYPDICEKEKNIETLPKPQVIEGYSKQNKYGNSKIKEEVNNSIESEEIEEFPKKGKQKNKYQSSKKVKYESVEYEDDYGDSYENED